MSAAAMPARREVLKPSELPAPPQDAIRIVQACAGEELDAQALGGLVGNDPVLTAELLRIANSAYFGFSSEVRSATRAVTVIGQRALRNIVLCISMRDALSHEQLPAFPLAEFWEFALRKAVCARALGEQAGLDPEECFTIGLLQDFGLLVLFYTQHHRICEWTRIRQALPDAQCELESRLFSTTHAAVGMQLAESWNLPATLGHAIGLHHTDEGAAERPEAGLCRLALCADWMAAVFTAEDKRGAIQRTRELLKQHFKVEQAGCDALLEQVETHMLQAGQALGFEVAEQPSFDQVLRKANLILVQDNLSFQEMNWKLEQALQERDRMAAELHQELELARDVQRSLLPVDTQGQLGVVGLNVSAKAVSGDFYDFFKVHSGQIMFCIADVSGKGMNAALLMAKTSSLFRCLGKGVHDPSKLLKMLNREICETSIRGMFVTMSVGIFDPHTRRVRLANAGHLPALQMDGHFMARQYPAAAPPLGIMADAEFPCEEFKLQQHSLYLYTDGLLEAHIAENQRLEHEGLVDLLARYKDINPVDRLQQLVAAVRKYPGGIDDDLTMLLIEGT